jgi:hypothetical protein
MNHRDDDKECGRLNLENKPKWAKPLVNPQTLKVILTVGPWIAKILRLAIELVKLFKG